MCSHGRFSQGWSYILILYLECTYIHTAGDYNNEDIRQLNDIQTCVGKDLRTGFEGHNIVEISWTPHLTHGMYTHVLFYGIN